VVHFQLLSQTTLDCFQLYYCTVSSSTEAREALRGRESSLPRIMLLHQDGAERGREALSCINYCREPNQISGTKDKVYSCVLRAQGDDRASPDVGWDVVFTARLSSLWSTTIFFHAFDADWLL